MSRMNSRTNKRRRSMARAAAQADSRGRIPFAGVCTTRRIVKGQRYLAACNLPHSRTVASVFIGR